MDGRSPHLAGTVPRRPVVHGQHRRLPGGGRSCQRVRPFFTGQVTAAGKCRRRRSWWPAAGVAGLAAIGTAKALGAIVRATDARPEVAEEVQSMGGEFLAVEVKDLVVFHRRLRQGDLGRLQSGRSRALRRAGQDVDIIITTALIPGRPAPLLITADMWLR